MLIWTLFCCHASCHGRDIQDKDGKPMTNDSRPMNKDEDHRKLLKKLHTVVAVPLGISHRPSRSF